MSSKQPPVVLVPPPVQAVGDGQPAKKRRGPKPKPKPYVAPKSVSRNERRYTIEKKREVLMFLEHHRVKNREGQPIRIRGGEERLEGEFRRPTLDEASEWFKIPYGSIHNWYKNKDTIFDPSLKGRRTRRKRDASGNLVDRNQPDAPAPAPVETAAPTETQSSTPVERASEESPATGREPSIPSFVETQQQAPTQPGLSTQPSPTTEALPVPPTATNVAPRRRLPEGSPNVTEDARPAAGAEDSSAHNSQGSPRPSASPAAGVDGSVETDTSTTTPEQAATVEPTAPQAPTENTQDAA
ncbi:hypothetical protein CkaCkLH20_07235 [Colletotrichum karsti]|uniref:Uncharacterized protein n=1 Tax=Colletotrichum karsti TaxID=1095194 RepID=A0A9P6LJX9_9PEZI|nr:uncharacterized protein CkaCkLH20_07235 [Colletotrichum karsti]KAF9875415.1 hypothetical protein CkaCkLH20_07235 [Colletotrichum karsti]